MNMPRRTPSAFDWSLDRRSPRNLANARILLAVIRCVRCLPGTFATHSHDDLGRALAPAVTKKMEGALRTTLKAHAASTRNQEGLAEGLDEDLERMFHNRAVLLVIGEALARRLPRFEAFFDEIETTLVAFIKSRSHPLDRNVSTLAQLISLSPEETEFLRLATAFAYSSLDRGLFSFVDSQAKIMKAVGRLCDVRGVRSSDIFRLDRPLARSGVLEALQGRYSGDDFSDLLCLSSLGERLLAIAYVDAAEMSSAVLKPMVPPVQATPLDWPHLSEAKSLLRAALIEALDKCTAGVNVMLYGAPGTGKTEFTRALLHEIGASAFAVGHMDHSGAEASRTERLASLHLSQMFGGHRQRSVLVLDEAEDIFVNDHHNPFHRLAGKSSESKAWMNQLLETNARPVIWISNRVRHIDPAYLRRFAFCLEFPKTPYTVRRRIAETTLAGCQPQTMDAIAACESITPALMTSAARFASLSKASGLGVDMAARMMIDEHSKAAGERPPKLLRANSTTRYDLRYLNIEGGIQIEQLINRLGVDATVTMSFAGPPGTGKTQFAAEIARQLGKRLVVRTASDINAKWYGESEQNVARMFHECDPTSEVLFLDEGDVLLGSRADTAHRADRAVTAEFLRWMETFEGIFICATNHLAEFDEALMRRFTFRLAFKPLSSRQRRTLFAELALSWRPDQRSEDPVLDTEVATRLAKLNHLTPGDFANVARRYRHLGPEGFDWLLELEAEHHAKGRVNEARVGFV